MKKAARAIGSDGVAAFGGVYHPGFGEGSSKLAGPQKWVEYANALSRPPVMIAYRLRSAILRGVKWTLRENPAGGKDARRGVEICEEGLLKNTRLRRPWRAIVPKAAMHFFHGASLHAFALGRRKDGLVVFTELAHRPMHTIESWTRRDESSPFEVAVQRTIDGKTVSIPLSQCLYLVDDIGDSPDGVGVLRLVVDRIRRVGKYETLEGSELFSSMAGTAIARVPLGEINAEVAGMPDEQKAAHKKKLLGPIETVVAERIKIPEKIQYAVLSSETYQGQDPNTISTIPKWDIQIVKGELQGLPEIRKVITDDDLNLARMLGVEFVFIGGGDTTGTYGTHESKVGVFAADLQTSADEVGVAGTNQLCRPLVAANGLDPDTACPELVPEQITIGDVLQAASLLEAEARAGAHPEDEAWDLLRERAQLPPRPKVQVMADLMAPRKPVGDDELDEEDEDEDELEDVDDPKDKDKPEKVKPADEKETKKP